MPFQITTQPFGTLPDAVTPLTEYLLEHPESGEFIAVVPGYGAVLRRLVLRKGRQLFALIKAPESPQALTSDEGYASAFLYPFPSRIRHGIYRFEEEAYTLDMNEPNRDNAIHGFVHGRPFTVVDQTVTPISARLAVRYDYAGDTTGYPFPFALTITYELVQADQLKLGAEHENDRMCALRVSYSAVNTGTTRAPAAFGWHPYFTLSEAPIDDMTLELPARVPVALDSTLLPNGFEPHEPAGTVDLHERTFNTPFVLDPAETDSFVESTLTSRETGVQLIVGQQTGPGKLNYLVCYTPARRDSIALEPQTAGVDAFNNGDGLTVLEPGDELSGTMWVRLA